MRISRALSLSLAPILLLLSLLAQEEARADSAPGALQVVHFGPSGETRELPSVDLLFSRPMVTDEEIGRLRSDGPIRFEPNLRGKFQWVTPRAVRFLPKDPEPGTLWRCQIREDTRSLSGLGLSESTEWEILFRRPELVATWLDANDSAFDPWREPLWVEFDAAVRDAKDAFELIAPSGPVALDLEVIEGPRVFLRPSEPLAVATAHDLRIHSDRLRLDGGGLSPAPGPPLRFRTPSPPRFTSAEFLGEETIRLRASSPIDPDSLGRFVRLDPLPQSGVRYRLDESAGGASKSDGGHILIEGDFPPGESVHLEIAPGVPSLFGLQSKRPASFHLVAPPREVIFQLLPEDGLLIPGPSEFVRFETRNVERTVLRSRWLTDDDFPLGENSPPSGSSSRFGPDSLWATVDTLSPSLRPNEIVTRDLLLAEIPGRPEGVRGITFDAVSTAQFDTNKHAKGDTLRLTRSVQFSSIGVSAFEDASHTLFWATDLITGDPLIRAEVTLWTDSLGVLSPRWQGKTNESGIVWGPGSEVFGHPLHSVNVTHRLGQTWLPLDSPDFSAARGPRAVVVTDRESYAPGEVIHYRAFLREIEGNRFHTPKSLRRAFATLTGPDWRQSKLSPLDSNGALDGTFRLPTRPGKFVLSVLDPNSVDPSNPSQPRTLGSKHFEVRALGEASANLVAPTVDSTDSNEVADTWPKLELPETTGHKTHALWVLHQEKLRSARVTESTKNPAVQIDPIAHLPGEIDATALVVGSDPSSARHGGGPRETLPYFRNFDFAFDPPASDWPASLSMEIRPESPTPGDTVLVVFTLRDRKGQSAAGQLTLAAAERPLGRSAVTDSTRFGDAFSCFFERRSEVSYRDSRNHLRISGRSATTAPTRSDPGTEPTGVAPSEARVDLAFAELPSPLANSDAGFRTISWRPMIRIDASGKAVLRFPLDGVDREYILRAFASIGSGENAGFAAGALHFVAADSIRAVWNVPPFARPGDSFPFDATILGDLPMDPKVRVGGGEASRVRTERSDAREASVYGRVVAASRPSLDFEVWSDPVSDAAPIGRTTVPIERPEIVESWIVSGAASPRSEVTLRLDAPEILASRGLDLVLSPTRQSELSDALSHTVRRDGPGLEPRISQLRAHQLAATLGNALPWTAPDLDVPQKRMRLLWQLSPTGDLAQPVDGSLLGLSARDASYLDAYAFSAWGTDWLDPALAEAYYERMDRQVKRLRSTEPVDLDLLAFTLFVLSEASPLHYDADLRWLLARDDRLSPTGKVLLGLALETRESREDFGALDAVVRRQIRAWRRVLFESLAEWRSESGLIHETSQAPLPYATGTAADLRATAWSLALLARVEPNHPLAQPLYQSLLDARQDGHWGTPHINVIAAESIRSFLTKVEQVALPSQGRIIFGGRKTEGVRFTREDPSAKTLHFGLDQLAAMRSGGDANPELRVQFETERLQTLHYQLRFPQETPIENVPARDEGLGVYRQYLDSNGDRISDGQRGETITVELVVAVPQRTSRLWLTEALPAGASVSGDLRVHAAPASMEQDQGDSGNPPSTVIEEDPSSTRRKQVWILPPLPVGIHVFTYDMTWDRDGTYNVPGTLVSALESVGVWGQSASERVRVK